MANMTLFVPDDFKNRLKKYPDVRWSSAIRTVISQKLDAFEELERLLANSKMTQADANILAKKVNAAAGKKAKALLNESSR